MNRQPDKKFLNRFFRSVYNKLEADALLFNRRLPHEGLKGSENEKALADVLRDFLPTTYGVESNVLIIDRNGISSRQCDIVIYDNVQFPRYFRKVYPIEIVYAVIEVKTQLTKQQVDYAKENETALRKLDFSPLLTPYWQTRTENEKIRHASPVHCIFGYRSSTDDFGTFSGWFSDLPTKTNSGDNKPGQFIMNPFIACALDKGVIFSDGGMVSRWLAVAEEKNNERNFLATGDARSFEVDPAKSLLLFLELLWTRLEQSPRHPGFDIRSYMDQDIGSFIAFDNDGRIEQE